jgi:transcriptional regulator with XRE-family HTH domain
MIHERNFEPISDAVLAEQWFSLRNKTWRRLTALVRSSGIEQKKIAERIDMDPGQFSKILSGAKGNVTLRTLHNIARAINHRLDVSLTPLSSLRKPNFSYSARSEDPQDEEEDWIRPHATELPRHKVLEDA